MVLTQAAIAGKGASANVKEFLDTFLPLADTSDECNAARDREWQVADTTGDDALSLDRIERWLQRKLCFSLGNRRGMEIYKAFFPTYLRAFQAALKEARGIEERGSDLISRDEFRQLVAHLCVFALAYDAFAQIDLSAGSEGSKQSAGSRDQRLTRTEWLNGCQNVTDHGFVTLADADADKSKRVERLSEMFDIMDENGGGTVSVTEFFEYVEATEVKAGTLIGSLLSTTGNYRDHYTISSPAVPAPLPNNSDSTPTSSTRTPSKEFTEKTRLFGVKTPDTTETSASVTPARSTPSKLEKEFSNMSNMSTPSKEQSLQENLIASPKSVFASPNRPTNLFPEALTSHHVMETVQKLEAQGKGTPGVDPATPTRGREGRNGLSPAKTPHLRPAHDDGLTRSRDLTINRNQPRSLEDIQNENAAIPLHTAFSMASKERLPAKAAAGDLIELNRKRDRTPEKTLKKPFITSLDVWKSVKMFDYEPGISRIVLENALLSERGEALQQPPPSRETKAPTKTESGSTQEVSLKIQVPGDEKPRNVSPIVTDASSTAAAPVSINSTSKDISTLNLANRGSLTLNLTTMSADENMAKTGDVQKPVAAAESHSVRTIDILAALLMLIGCVYFFDDPSISAGNLQTTPVSEQAKGKHPTPNTNERRFSIVSLLNSIDLEQHYGHTVPTREEAAVIAEKDRLHGTTSLQSSNQQGTQKSKTAIEDHEERFADDLLAHDPISSLLTSVYFDENAYTHFNRMETCSTGEMAPGPMFAVTDLSTVSSPIAKETNVDATSRKFSLPQASTSSQRTDLVYDIDSHIAIPVLNHDGEVFEGDIGARNTNIAESPLDEEKDTADIKGGSSHPPDVPSFAQPFTASDSVTRNKRQLKATRESVLHDVSVKNQMSASVTDVKVASTAEADSHKDEHSGLALTVDNALREEATKEDFYADPITSFLRSLLGSNDSAMYVKAIAIADKKTKKSSGWGRRSQQATDGMNEEFFGDPISSLVRSIFLADPLVTIVDTQGKGGDEVKSEQSENNNQT